MHGDICNTHTQYVHMHIGVYILYIVTCAFASLFVVHLGGILVLVCKRSVCIYYRCVYRYMCIYIYIYIFIDIGIYTWIENNLNKELKKWL